MTDVHRFSEARIAHSGFRLRIRPSFTDKEENAASPFLMMEIAIRCFARASRLRLALPVELPVVDRVVLIPGRRGGSNYLIKSIYYKL